MNKKNFILILLFICIILTSVILKKDDNKTDYYYANNISTIDVNLDYLKLPEEFYENNFIQLKTLENKGVVRYFKTNSVIHEISYEVTSETKEVIKVILVNNAEEYSNGREHQYKFSLDSYDLYIDFKNTTNTNAEAYINEIITLNNLTEK